VKKFKNLLDKRKILLYGYKDKHLPDKLKTKQDEILVYTKSPNKLNKTNYTTVLRKYDTTKDIGWSKADIVMLDNEAIKGVVIGYPTSVPYVLVALGLPRYWLWLCIGLIRRAINGQIKIMGVVRLKSEHDMRTWLILNNCQENARLSLSSSIGVGGLLNYLSLKKINYVIIRFYQKLPELFRKSGDLDILVADEDQERLQKFVMENPGSIPLDIFSVSEPSYNGISYYLPRLAKQILKGSIEGPGNSRIPNKKDSLLSLIYHVLYHKGINSGIPSTTIGIESLEIKNNSYVIEIQKMAKELGINVGSSMEDLESYLSEEGWCPKIDTLAKIAQWNEWVRKKYFSNTSSNYISISVFILRELAITNNAVEQVKTLIRKEGFQIIREIYLKGNVRAEAIKHLRGGTWKDSMYKDNSREFEPAYAVIILDSLANNFNRFTSLKEKIRKNFDHDKSPSIVHSTDNEIESWDYINYCFHGMEKEIKKSIQKSKKKKSFNLSYLNFIKILPYYKASINTKIKSWILNMVTK
jgi:hypothetical protein